MADSWDDAVAHFLATGPIGVLTIDSAYGVVHANDASGSILGHEATGRSLLDLIYPDDVARVIAASVATPAVRRRTAGGIEGVVQRSGRGIVIRMVLSDGRPIEVLAHTATVQVGEARFGQIGFLPAPPRLAVLEALAGVASARPLTTTFETLAAAIASDDSGVAINWVDVEGAVHVFGNLPPILSGVDERGRRDTDADTPWVEAANRRSPARLRDLDDIRPEVAAAARAAGYVACCVSPVDDPATQQALLYVNWLPHPSQLDYAEQAFADVLADVFRLALERAEDARQMRHAALHDQLTGLGNRRAFFATLSTAIAEGSTSVLYLDLDGFKAVNDELGHDAGDRALMAVADRIRACSPPQAVIARLGGDEFAIVVPDDPGSVAEVLADRLLTEVARPFDLDGYGTVSMGVSIGVAATEGVMLVDPNDLVVAADDALRIAKAEGKGAWVRHRSRIVPGSD